LIDSKGSGGSAVVVERQFFVSFSKVYSFASLLPLSVFHRPIQLWLLLCRLFYGPLFIRGGGRASRGDPIMQIDFLPPISHHLRSVTAYVIN
jgi:hypothetical protein